MLGITYAMFIIKVYTTYVILIIVFYITFVMFIYYYWHQLYDVFFYFVTSLWWCYFLIFIKTNTIYVMFVYVLLVPVKWCLFCIFRFCLYHIYGIKMRKNIKKYQFIDVFHFLFFLLLKRRVKYRNNEK